ncbi:ADYC domain-containing protein [Nannocystis pusilla]|uniref:ADYC domain-containing protein n=1 Tax=Nannocystis pusilla TaxID=889268 RepID=UPI003B810C6C
MWVNVTSGAVKDGTLEAKVGTTVYRGADLVGSRWELTLFNADTDGDGDHDADDEPEVDVELRIASFQQISPKEAHYTFETVDELGNIVPVCDADTDGVHTMVPIKDLTVNEVTGRMGKRSNTLYLACTSGAVGKAVQWGYKPWERPIDEFEVATRMVRADYCFDGTSYTQTGTHLQIKDKYQINTFLRSDDPTEAVWSKSGVRCINTPQRHLHRVAGGVRRSDPAGLLDHHQHDDLLRRAVLDQDRRVDLRSVAAARAAHRVRRLDVPRTR